MATGRRRAADPLTTYTAAELAAAQVCGALEITTPDKGWHEIAAGGTGVPAGGTDDGATLHAPAPHGSEITLSFRQLVMSYPSGWMAELQPVALA